MVHPGTITILIILGWSARHTLSPFLFFSLSLSLTHTQTQTHTLPLHYNYIPSILLALHSALYKLHKHYLLKAYCHILKVHIEYYTD